MSMPHKPLCDRRGRMSTPARVRYCRPSARACNPSASGCLARLLGEPHFTPTFSVVTASLNVSYVPDVFGGTRREIESLAAQAEYQRFQLEATYLTFDVQSGGCRRARASLRGQITATERILKIENDELDLVRQRSGWGLCRRPKSYCRRRRLTRPARPCLPCRNSWPKCATSSRHSPDGCRSRGVSQTFTLDSLRLPQELPVSLPSRLVEQRPDVRGAEAQLHTASADVGVAIANQLPQFAITGAFGTTATGFDALPGTGVWSLAGSAEQTLFDAGTLLHRKRAAVAALSQAAAQYRSTVLKAFQNVSDALRALQADADDLVAQDAAERSALASLELARRQFHADTIDHLTVLIAERTWEQAYINRVQAEGNRYADTAALFQALGGGWWHRTDAKQSGDSASQPMPSVSSTASH